MMLRPSLRDVRVITLVSILLLLCFSPACNRDATSEDVATLTKLDDDWSKALAAKDVEKTVSYYADDALMMPPNIPTLTGKDSIRTLWKSLLEAPGFAGGWKATKVEVARSGDLAYVSGNYELTGMNDRGESMTDKGKYLAVWKKQPDGGWKCAANMFHSDMSPAPPLEPSR